MNRHATDWLSRLQDRSVALPAEVDAAKASKAVMCVLVDRLTTGEAHALFEALPPSLRGLFRSCEDHRERRAVDRFDRAELIMRVARHLGVTPAHAESITASVLAAVRRELPDDVVENVAAQLPRDLKALWLSSGAISTPPGPVVEAGARELVEAEIGRQLAALHASDLAPAAALGAVMGLMFQRMSGGEAWHVFMGLPEELHPLLEGAALDRGEEAQVFGRTEMLAEVAKQLRIPEGEAELVARAVFAAVRHVLPTKDVDDVASQLPVELRDLWFDA